MACLRRYAEASHDAHRLAPMWTANSLNLAVAHTLLDQPEAAHKYLALGIGLGVPRHLAPVADLSAQLALRAPDLMSAGFSRTVVRSAGSATLYVELWDSASNSILARAMDAQADQGYAGMGQTANRVTNTMAADDILRGWAGRLRRYLDAARAKPAG